MYQIKILFYGKLAGKIYRDTAYIYYIINKIISFKNLYASNIYFHSTFS